MNSYWKEVAEFLFNLSILLVLTSLILPSSITNYGELNLHAGILNQSQAYGYLLTLLLPIQIIYFKYNPSQKWLLVLILLSCYFIIISKMRSALIVLIALSLITYIFSKFKELKIGFTILVGILFLSILIMGNDIFNRIFSKRNEEIKLASTEEMFYSRYQLLEPALENFDRYPFFGIGFGIPSEITDKDFNINDRWGIKYLPGTEIIISLPTEKGIVYSAIIEELGLFGAFFFAVFFLNFFIGYNYDKLLLITPIFILSISEASLLSPNGIGIFALLMLIFSKAINLNESNLMYYRRIRTIS